MKIKPSNKAIQAAVPPQRKPYKSPLLNVFGAVYQFTQGSGTTAMNDASIGMVRVMSDRVSKTNLVRIGTHPLNIGLYFFDYKPEFQATAGFGRHFGVMADEVETVMPEAVLMHADGFKRVNYGMLGIDISTRWVH